MPYSGAAPGEPGDRGTNPRSDGHRLRHIEVRGAAGAGARGDRPDAGGAEHRAPRAARAHRLADLQPRPVRRGGGRPGWPGAVRRLRPRRRARRALRARRRLPGISAYAERIVTAAHRHLGPGIELLVESFLSVTAST